MGSTCIIRLYYVSVFILGTGRLKQIYRFGTKTAYEASIGYWSQSDSKSKYSSHVDLLELVDKLNSSTSFVHRRWPEFCSPVQLNALIRHGIRNLGQNDIIHFLSVVNKISSRPESANHNFNDLLNTLFELTDIVTSYEEKSLLPQGRDEQKYVARRIYDMYSDLLVEMDVDDIYLVVSSSQRTVDSCLAFMEEWMRKTNSLQSNPPLHTNDTLIRFFDKCGKYVKEIEEQEKVALNEYYKYQGDNFNKISEKLSKKLNLNEEQSLSKKEVKALYMISAIEVAALKTNKVLALFDDEDITLLEYATDLKNYWKKSFGHEINYRQSCPLLLDVFQHLENVIQNRNRYKAVLRFGHAETLLPLVALLGLFKDEVQLNAENQDIHADRKFRTSRISPFSANVFFVLYECDKHIGNGISWKKDMIQVVVNEMPVVLPGCEHDFCPYETFYEQYKDILDTCNFENICRLQNHDEL